MGINADKITDMLFIDAGTRMKFKYNIERPHLHHAHSYLYLFHGSHRTAN